MKYSLKTPVAAPYCAMPSGHRSRFTAATVAANAPVGIAMAC